MGRVLDKDSSESFHPLRPHKYRISIYVTETRDGCEGLNWEREDPKAPNMVWQSDGSGEA